jgi:hypothetical protein
LGSFVDHDVSRVECKRLASEISDYRLSYNFDITKREIENKVLKINYVFTIEYKEEVGQIVIEGSIGYKDGPKTLKDLNKNWDKNIDFQKRLYNLIFRNGVTMMMDISRHLGLPSPIFFPEINPGNLS